IAAGDDDIGTGRQQACHHAEQSGLADAARPEQAGAPAGRERDVKILEQHRVAEREAASMDGDVEVRRLSDNTPPYAGVNRIRFEGSSRMDLSAGLPAPPSDGGRVAAARA